MNDDVPIGLLIALLFFLLALSAFFSSTETALISLNRHRLRQSARAGNRAARLAEALLHRPDRLIGLIQLGKHAANLGAAAVVTLIALRVGGEGAILVGTLLLTFVVLVFAEVAPKTFAVTHPEKVALPAARVYYPLLKIAYPFVRLVNLTANGLLRVLGARPDETAASSPSADELRSVLAEAAVKVPRREQRMLLSVLDLDAMTVDDVMVPRQEIVGLDLERDWEENLEVIRNCEFDRMPVYRDDIDNIVGVVRLRRILPELARGTLTERRLLEQTREPHFVPEGTPLTKQLLNFHESKRRSAFVVDEYGDVQGLITTQDIVREIVGELDNDARPVDFGIVQDERGYVIDASVNLRQLNRLMNWSLPTDGPKTLNGLILEQLERIPEAGTDVVVADYPMEVLALGEHAVAKVRIIAPAEVPEPQLRAS